MKPRIRRLLIVAVAMVVTLATLFTIWNVRSARRLETARAAIEQAGLPASIARIPEWQDHRFGSLTEAENGAAHMEAAFALLEDTELDVPEWPDDAPEHLPEPDDATAGELARLGQAIELTRTGLAAPRCRLHADWQAGIAVQLDLLPTIALANLLEWRVVADLAADDDAAALDHAGLLCRLPRILAEEPTLLGWMLRLALIDRADQLLRRFAERGFDPATLRELAIAPPAGNALQAIGGECAWALSAYDTLRTGSFGELGIGEPSTWQRFLQNTSLVTPLLRNDIAHLLDHYLQLWELRNLSPGAALEPVRKIQASMLPEDPGIDSLLSSLLAADIASAIERECQLRASLRATQAGFDQLLDWRDNPPSEPSERTFGDDDGAWTVRSR